MSEPREPAQAWPPVAELVPHEPPMRLVDELLDWAPDRARVRARVRANNPLAQAGKVPATILLELMAQAIAVAAGMNERVAGRRSDVGLLLGTRELDLHVTELVIGDELTIDVVRSIEQDKLARWACTVERGDQTLARAELNVWAGRPDEQQGA